MSRHGVTLDLPPELSQLEAEAINRQCQQLDGISTITPDGTICFSPKNMDIMRDLLGYHCSKITVAESRAAATELSARYRGFLTRQGLATL